MDRARLPDLARGAAAALLALLPACFSFEGLVTGHTRAVAKHAYTHDGAAGIVTAIAYGLFAVALALAAARFVSTGTKRRATLFKWAMNAMTVGAVCMALGGLVWAVQDWWM